MADNVEFELRYHERSSQLVIVVRNHAQPARIRVLEREFERSTEGDAGAAFARAVARLQRLPSGTSMLGLSRLASEAQLELKVDGTLVELTARVRREDDNSSPIVIRVMAESG
jgi:hypothetical protein